MQDKSKNILVIVVGFLVLFYFTSVYALLYIALLVGLACIFSSWIADKVNWLWLKIAEILGFINSKIILSIIFFVFLTPLALLFKMIGSGRKKFFHRGADSTYIERNHEYVPKDMENTW